ncbi:unnamed protein product [Phytomonas sp. Hart1]|nr:unnamed protein product [Phytomonas sp. Hart1]|eukprot:CCW71756.1 unnamed protein product [Phytomonas sp. isolate Hart1]
MYNDWFEFKWTLRLVFLLMSVKFPTSYDLVSTKAPRVGILFQGPLPASLQNLQAMPIDTSWCFVTRVFYLGC